MNIEISSVSSVFPRDSRCAIYWPTATSATVEVKGPRRESRLFGSSPRPATRPLFLWLQSSLKLPPVNVGAPPKSGGWSALGSPVTEASDASIGGRFCTIGSNNCRTYDRSLAKAEFQGRSVWWAICLRDEAPLERTAMSITRHICGHSVKRGLTGIC